MKKIIVGVQRATRGKPRKNTAKPSHKETGRERPADRPARPRRERPQGHHEAHEGSRPRRERPPRTERPPRDERHAVPHPRAEPPPTAPRKPWNPAEYTVAPAEGKTRFHDLDLSPDIMHGLCDLGFQYCTPIQAGILPITLKGRDAAGQAQTGTGKTAAFLITIFQHMLRNPLTEPRKPGCPRALILAPTRELVTQIAKDAHAIGLHLPFSCLAVYGGKEFEKQRTFLQTRQTDVVAATPGRLLDFIQRGDLDLGQVEILVLDEADRMLDMGFIPDVKRIVRRTPHKERRQTLLFSATLSKSVMWLAAEWMKDPERVEIQAESVAADTVNQLVYIVTAADKFPLLYNLMRTQADARVIVFVNRRDTAERLQDHLIASGVPAALLSGAVDQHKREKTLERFRTGEDRVLVATDVASRGLHVEGVTHIVNFNVPFEAQDYVHRIGRTGRAGAEGTSITFADEEEAHSLPDIEAFIGKPLKYIQPEPELLVAPPVVATPPRRERHDMARGYGGGRPSRGPHRPGGRGRPPRRPGR